MSPAPNLAAVHVTAEELLRRVAGEVVRAGVKLVAEPRFQPFDWNANHHEVEYLEKPYIPAGARIWLWGPAESAKSIFAQALAARLTREGRIVAYFDQENPEVELVRRWRRLRPDFDHLRLYAHQGLDLADASHVKEVIDLCRGVELIVFDTISACWNGDENENPAINQLDRTGLEPIVRETGATLLIPDHTGHPQAFVKRSGASAGRGASAKGQKADCILVIEPKASGEFLLTHAKNRFGGVKEPPRLFRVVDTEDGGLDVEMVEGEAIDDRVLEIADAMVEVVRTNQPISTNGLRDALMGTAGKTLQNDAMDLLKSEEPPRVAVAGEVLETARGRQRVKAWRWVAPGGSGSPEVVPSESRSTSMDESGSPGVEVPIGTPGLPDPPELEGVVGEFQREFGAEYLDG